MTSDDQEQEAWLGTKDAETQRLKDIRSGAMAACGAFAGLAVGIASPYGVVRSSAIAIGVFFALLFAAYFGALSVLLLTRGAE